MKILYTKKFNKDLDSIVHDEKLKKHLLQLLQELQQKSSLKKMSQHLLLDISVIVDLWCGINAARESEQLIDKAVANAIQIVLLHAFQVLYLTLCPLPHALCPKPHACPQVTPAPKPSTPS